MGRTKVYDLLPQTDRSTVQRNIDPAGLTTLTKWSGNAVIETTSPDSTITRNFLGPDPLASLQSMRSARTLITTPGGLARESHNVQKVTLADSSNPLSLVSFEDSNYVNYKLTARAYIDSLRMWITTSPEGRKDTVLVDSLNRIISHLVPGAEAIEYTYDSRGRIATVSQGSGPLQRTTQYSYNTEGFVSKIKNAVGDSVSFEYDLSGRLSREVLPGGQEVDYAYDADGNLDTLLPPGKPAHVFAYNPVGLDTLYSPPVLGAGTFHTASGYNLDQQLLKVNRPDGKAIDYVYDFAGRMDSIKVANGAYVFGYGPVTGRLDSIAAPGGIVNRFTYDGAFLTQADWDGPMTGSIHSTYDNDFRLSTQTVGGGWPIGFTYDQDGFRTTAGAMAYTWDAQGRLTSASLGIVHDTLIYDIFGQARQYAAVKGTDTLYRYYLTRDKLGRIQEKIETIGGTTHSYQYAYDARGRLTSVSIDSALWTSYTYDGNGNRLTRTRSGVTDTGTYDDQDRLTQYGSRHFAYNNQGDLERAFAPFDTLKRPMMPSGTCWE